MSSTHTQTTLWAVSSVLEPPPTPFLLGSPLEWTGLGSLAGAGGCGDGFPKEVSDLIKESHTAGEEGRLASGPPGQARPLLLSWSCRLY